MCKILKVVGVVSFAIKQSTGDVLNVPQALVLFDDFRVEWIGLRKDEGWYSNGGKSAIAALLVARGLAERIENSPTRVRNVGGGAEIDILRATNHYVDKIKNLYEVVL